MSRAKSIDAHRDARLMRLVDKLMDMLEAEGVTVRELTAALAAIARIRIGYFKLPEDEEAASVGSAVRKYSSEFAARTAGINRARSYARSADDDLNSADDDDPAA